MMERSRPLVDGGCRIKLQSDGGDRGSRVCSFIGVQIGRGDQAAGASSGGDEVEVCLIGAGLVSRQRDGAISIDRGSKVGSGACSKVDTSVASTADRKEEGNSNVEVGNSLRAKGSSSCIDSFQRVGSVGILDKHESGWILSRAGQCGWKQSQSQLGLSQASEVSTVGFDADDSSWQGYDNRIRRSDLSQRSGRKCRGSSLDGSSDCCGLDDDTSCDGSRG